MRAVGSVWSALGQGMLNPLSGDPSDLAAKRRLRQGLPVHYARSHNEDCHHVNVLCMSYAATATFNMCAGDTSDLAAVTEAAAGKENLAEDAHALATAAVQLAALLPRVRAKQAQRDAAAADAMSIANPKRAPVSQPAPYDFVASYVTGPMLCAPAIVHFERAVPHAAQEVGRRMLNAPVLWRPPCPVLHA